LIFLNPYTKKLPLITDSRGWLTEILESEPSETIQNVHFAVSEPGALRGNHYHKNKIEWQLVTNGAGTVTLEDNDTKEKTQFTVSGESPTLIKIPSNVTHSILNSGNSPMHILIITNQKHDPKDSDTFRK
jgi:UDP-2-acetamido-2,6-beta-L-arabino-hexul-4-ose reductase